MDINRRTLRLRPTDALRRLPCTVSCLIAVAVLVLGTALVLVQSDVASLVSAGRMGAAADKRLDALLYAVETRDLPTVRRLLNSPGLDLNVLDREGLNPLLRAARGRWTECCRLLLDRGADVNAADGQGRTCLFYAALAAGEVANEMTELLIQRGADVDTADAIGQTPLMAAAEFGRGDMARRLIDAGADVNRRAKSGFTALHWAVLCEYPDVSRLLLAADADPEARDDEGRTPRQLATPDAPRSGH